MTIQDYIKQGNEWINLKGVPMREQDSENIMFIHNKFFSGEELIFQNKVISSFLEICPDRDWVWRVYGGNTPDANMVKWIYTQIVEIVKTADAVYNYLKNEGITTCLINTECIQGCHPSRALVEKVAQIFNLKYTYLENNGEFKLSGFDI